MAKVAVIVAGAGRGERFGTDRSKIFAKLQDRPLFVRALEMFVNREDVVQTILAVSPADVETVKEKYAANIMFMGVKLVEGGVERPETVRKALAVVDESADLIAVHDAVRVCVAAEWIDAVFAEAAKTGGAILAAPLSGTIKRVTDQKVIDATVDRTGLWEAQTPQVFRRDVLMEAYEKLGDADGITDDAQVVEQAGHPVAVVPCDGRNLKITLPGDLKLAQACLRVLPKPKTKAPRSPFEEAQW